MCVWETRGEHPGCNSYLNQEGWLSSAWILFVAGKVQEGEIALRAAPFPRARCWGVSSGGEMGAGRSTVLLPVCLRCQLIPEMCTGGESVRAVTRTAETCDNSSQMPFSCLQHPYVLPRSIQRPLRKTSGGAGSCQGEQAGSEGALGASRDLPAGAKCRPGLRGRQGASRVKTARFLLCGP